MLADYLPVRVRSTFVVPVIVTRQKGIGFSLSFNQRFLKVTIL
jgi:hypothetical protein